MYLKKINLKGKYALVTGAGKGLGRACSIASDEAATFSSPPILQSISISNSSQTLSTNFSIWDVKLGVSFKNLSKLLSEGKVVGYFQDNMEFGSRALGNRSILCDPRIEKIDEYLNLKN